MNKDTMEQPNQIQAFDALFTNNQIQIYKLLLPYLDSSMQKNLAIHIKYMEFQYTLNYLRIHPHAILPQKPMPDSHDICNEILPFCSPSQKAKVEQFTGMFANIRNMKEMMETINMMKEMFPEGFSFDKDGAGDGCGPDIAQIMQMFGGSF